MPVVHCTYLIRHEILDQMSYDDGSGRHEYVIFSENARKKGIPQYLDNRQVYGRITFAENKEDLDKEAWLCEFVPTKIEDVFTRIYENGVWARNKEGKAQVGRGVRHRLTPSFTDASFRTF